MNETISAALVVLLIILIPLFLAAGLLAGAAIGYYWAVYR